MAMHGYATQSGLTTVQLPFKSYLRRLRTVGKHKPRSHKMSFLQANPNFTMFTAALAAIVTIPVVMVLGAIIEGGL